MPLLPHPPKFYQRLQEPTHRQATGLYLAPGKKLLTEAVKSLRPQDFHAIFYTKASYVQGLPSELAAKAFPLPEWQLARISGLESPEGVVAVLHLPPPVSLSPPLPPAVLGETLQDPGNVGTLLRTMEWFGYSYLWLNPTSSDPYHPRTVRASMGSLFRLHAQRVQDWQSLVRHYEGRCIVADLNGCPPEAVDWTQYDSLYLGNEARGCREAPPDWPRVKIPPAPTSQADSLNVTIAAAILLYTASALRTGRLHTSPPLSPDEAGAGMPRQG